MGMFSKVDDSGKVVTKVDCSNDEVITEQHHALACDVNFVVERFAATGVSRDRDWETFPFLNFSYF